MKRKITLIINGQEADLNGQDLILFNYQTDDLSNPTIVKNSYSQSVTLQGTPNNNKIFSHLYKADRSVDASSFNPLKKTDFEIWDDQGHLLEAGYCKLDKMTHRGADISYSVTLYGGLGSFLYELMYNENGEKKTLADLDWLGTDNPETEFDFTINRTAVQAAWDALANSDDAKWDAINFAPCYNGIPDNFDSDKALLNCSRINTQFGYTLIPTSHDGCSAHNGYALATLGREFTEWEMQDLRSYLQRPVFSLKAFLTAISRTSNNGGYSVVLDDAFFNDNNEYYTKAWCTLPLLSESKQYKSTNTDVTITFGGATSLYNEGSLRINLSTLPASSQITANVNISTKFRNDGAVQAYLRGSYNVEEWQASQDYPDLYEWMTYGYNYGAFFQLVAYDSSNNIIAAGPAVMMRDSRWSAGKSASEVAALLNYTPILDAGVTADVVFYSMNRESAGVYTGPTIPLAVECYGAAYFKVHYTPFYLEKYEFRLCYDRRNIAYYESAFFCGIAAFTGGFQYTQDGLNKAYMYPMTCYMGDGGNSKIRVTSGDSLRSGMAVTKRHLMSTDKTPADYLLSYCKTFGLYITKDPATKTIYIRRRDTQYLSTILNIDKRIERGKARSVVPILAASKWYRLMAEAQGELADTYKALYGRPHGAQLINTGYDFNGSITDLLKDYAFKAAVETLDESIMYANPKANGNYYMNWQTLSYSILYGSGSSTATLEQPAQKASSYKYWGIQDTCDCWPKPQFCGSDNSPAGGDGVLLFLNSSKYAYTTHYYLSDDSAEMFNQNEGKPCWLVEFGGTYSALASNIPQFGRNFRQSQSVVSRQMDFGTPAEVYNRVTRSLKVGSSIYEQYWRNFVADRYDKDSKVVTCWVNLQGMEVNVDLLRRFYYFDGCIWVMNKIINHAINTCEATQCEFIKVKDAANYGVAIDTITYTLSYATSPNPLAFAKTGGTATLTITTNDTWQLVLPAWITADIVAGGTDGETTQTTITLTASANTLYSQRTGQIQIVGASTGTKAVNATQQAADQGGGGRVYRINYLCTSCGTCLSTCPVDAIRPGGYGYYIDEDVCISCGNCASECPVAAIELVDE